MKKVFALIMVGALLTMSLLCACTQNNSTVGDDTSAVVEETTEAVEEEVTSEVVEDVTEEVVDETETAEAVTGEDEDQTEAPADETV